MLYNAWTKSDRGRSPHIQLNDLQLQPRHAHLLPWFLYPRTWTMALSSVIVVQGRWYRYGYAIPLFNECYDTPMDILSQCFMPQTTEWPPTPSGHVQLLPRFLDASERTMHINNRVVIQGWWHMSGYDIPLFHECHVRHVPHMTWVDHSTYHWMASNYTLDMLSCHPSSRTHELEPWSSAVV